MMVRFALLAPLFLTLAACATLSEDQCRAGAWYDIGRNDGADGRKASFLTQHAKACAEYGVRPDTAEWQRGRADGLPLYCTPERAHREGTRGKHLSPVCPAESVARLEHANARGLRYHQIGQEISEINRDIHQINAELSSLEPGDPARSHLISERRFLRLALLTLRTERARYRSY